MLRWRSYECQHHSIPDAWQKLKGLDPSKAEANGHQLSTGYENLEVYIDDLVHEILLKQK
ncbi:MAG: hypothetical protein IPP42_00735 [Saprospiraceae bacterium]|nr:hypothetical protein [Saprospiraceae bacterium]